MFEAPYFAFQDFQKRQGFSCLVQNIFIISLYMSCNIFHTCVKPNKSTFPEFVLQCVDCLMVIFTHLHDSGLSKYILAVTEWGDNTGRTSNWEMFWNFVVLPRKYPCTDSILPVEGPNFINKETEFPRSSRTAMTWCTSRQLHL